MAGLINLQAFIHTLTNMIALSQADHQIQRVTNF